MQGWNWRIPNRNAHIVYPRDSNTVKPSGITNYSQTVNLNLLWHSSVHSIFPAETRHDIYLWLLVSKHLNVFPIEMIYAICEYIAGTVECQPAQSTIGTTEAMTKVE